jgi:hypothetical protein
MLLDLRETEDLWFISIALFQNPYENVFLIKGSFPAHSMVENEKNSCETL